MSVTVTALKTSRLDAAYREKFAGSAKLYERSSQLFPSGVTHDSRYLQPFPIFANEASGSKKIDVDGHELIDFWTGHGAMLLGHSHPAVVDAVQKQMAKSTHPGACHELEIEWAERIRKLVPSAERIRFTNSGTEATLMALRVARIATGRTKVIKFAGHFHGSRPPPNTTLRESLPAFMATWSSSRRTISKHCRKRSTNISRPVSFTKGMDRVGERFPRERTSFAACGN